MKPDFYNAVVFMHVVSAVISIGPLFILMPVIKRLRGVQSDVELAYMSVIKVTIRIVMHAGHVLVFSGALLILTGPWPWHTSWVVMTIIVLAISGFFLATGFTRVLRTFNIVGINKNELLDRLNRTSWLYIGLMLVMLWLMVQKPNFW